MGSARSTFSFYLLGPRRVAHVLTALVAYIVAHGTDTQTLTGQVALNMLPVDVRASSIPLNIIGGLFMFGGAAWSARTFWRKRVPSYRLVSMVLPALGAVFPSILTGMQALGNGGGAALGELLGTLCLLAGLLISLEVFTVFRVPFTNIVLHERLLAEAQPAQS